MGAWGMQAFENDFALDFTAHLFHESKAGDLSLLSEAFQDTVQAHQEGYMDSDLGSPAIAAAALLVYLKQGDVQAILNIQPEGRAWFEAATQQNYQALMPAALEALDLVTADNSELYELWQDTEHFTDWLNSVNQIRAALRA